MLMQTWKSILLIRRIRGITPKRVTSRGAHLAARLGNTFPKKRRSGGEPFGTLCPIWPSRGSNLKPPAPIVMFQQLSEPVGPFF